MHCSHLAGNKGRRRYRARERRRWSMLAAFSLQRSLLSWRRAVRQMCSNAVRKKSHCGLLFSAALCTGGRRKEQVGGPFERRRPERCAASAALPHHHCLICNESSIQSESDEVCQSSGFRVKCVLFHLSSPTRVTSLPLPLSLLHMLLLHDASNSNCLIADEV